MTLSYSGHTYVDPALEAERLTLFSDKYWTRAALGDAMKWPVENNCKFVIVWKNDARP